MPNAPSSASPRMTSGPIRCSRSILAGSMWSFANARNDSRNAETVSRSVSAISG